MERETEEHQPRTPGSGASACACDVIRPPKDFPPAKRGTEAELERAGDGRTDGRLRERRAIRSLGPGLCVRELKSQAGNLPLHQAVGHGCHEGVPHACCGRYCERKATAMSSPGLRRVAKAIMAGDGTAATNGTRSGPAKTR